MPRRITFASIAPFVLALATSVSAQNNASGDTYTYSCSPAAGDLINNIHTCRKAEISDGESFHLSAGLATVIDARGLALERSEWRLTEGVRMSFETAELSADSALLVFDADGEIARFELAGLPAEFSDTIPDRDAVIQATAQRIAYDADSDSFSMLDGVRFNGLDGDGIDACTFTYWLGEKRFVVGTTECESLITLTPPSAEGPPEPSNAGP